MCGMKGKSVVGLLIPMCTGCASSAVCKQAVDEQKKKQNHINSQKRDLYFFFSFFLDFNKSGERRGLQFCVLLFLPCDSLQLKNKTLARPSMVSHSTRVRRRTR